MSRADAIILAYSLLMALLCFLAYMQDHTDSLNERTIAAAKKMIAEKTNRTHAKKPA